MASLDLGAITERMRGWIPGGTDIFDQGANVVDLYSAFTRQPSPVVVPPVSTGSVITQTGTGVAGTSMGTPMPGNLPPTNACDDDPMKGYVYKKVCGVWKWVKPKRRRRKVLLTESDYNGLLRIESLKVNKNMTVAIAKTLSR